MCDGLITRDGPMSDAGSSPEMTAIRDESEHLGEVASILDFPNEILRDIVALLYNRHLVSFAVTCKLFYQLAESALCEHRELIRLYTTVSNLHKPRGKLASLLLLNLHDPRIGNYIHTLEVVLSEPEAESETPRKEARSMLDLLTSDDQEPLVTRKFGSGSWELWKDHVGLGDADFFLTRWCRMLVNISELTLYINVASSSFLTLVLEPYPGSYHSQFANLRRVRMSSSSPWRGYPLLEYFSRLPSLNLLSVANFAIDDPETCSIASEPYISHIKYFSLKDCSLGIRPLSALLYSMQSLEDFSYNELYERGHWRSNTNPVALIASLKAAASHTLKTLILQDDSDWDPPPHIEARDYLQGFAALQTATLRYRQLVNNCGPFLDQAARPLLLRLPKSLRILKSPGPGVHELE